MKAADLFDLTGEVALVTGASSGLGLRFARVLAANGAKVVCVARRKDRLDALVATIAAEGGEALAVAADVTDGAAMAAAFDAAEAAFGVVTVLVNNAGIARPQMATEVPMSAWREVLGINLDAVFANAQMAGQRLIRAGHKGSIINIASILGLGVSKGLASYAVAKSGVIQLSKSLAFEWAGKGVRVNAIAPGYFVTEINGDYLSGPQGETLKKGVPLGRFGAEGDLDGILLTLASRAGAFITGAVMVADGGQSIGLRG